MAEMHLIDVLPQAHAQIGCKVVDVSVGKMLRSYSSNFQSRARGSRARRA
jgi:hypothetical protein